MIDLPKLTQATLPEGMAEADRSIASMDVGEDGWTVPWAMYADQKRRLWLNGNYTIHPTPGGTVCMFVFRDENGWHVNAAKCDSDQRWGNGKGFVGGALGVAVSSFVR